jgi:cytochrome d ubiquinol oxidase subunit I
LVAIGSNISAFWILVANSFMQSPVGYVEENGHLVMSNFSALLTNPYVWGQFPHTIFSGFTTASFFVLGISAYHLIRKKNVSLFKRSFQIASVVGILAVLLVILVGHTQAQRMVRLQPMKIAAAEGLLQTEDPASLSLFTIVDQNTLTSEVSIRIPRLLSLLAYNRLTGKVEGIKDLQTQYQAQYGPGNYVPSITMTYWAFRIMIGAGFLMLALAAYALYRVMRNQLKPETKYLRFFPLAMALPYLANIFGWILTEMGRQPWVVYGKLRTADAVSPNLTVGMVLTSLIGFTLVYGALMGADVYLLAKAARSGPEDEQPALASQEESDME